MARPGMAQVVKKKKVRRETNDPELEAITARGDDSEIDDGFNPRQQGSISASELKREEDSKKRKRDAVQKQYEAAPNTKNIIDSAADPPAPQKSTSDGHSRDSKHLKAAKQARIDKDKENMPPPPLPARADKVTSRSASTRSPAAPLVTDPAAKAPEKQVKKNASQDSGNGRPESSRASHLQKIVTNENEVFYVKSVPRASLATKEVTPNLSPEVAELLAQARAMYPFPLTGVDLYDANNLEKAIKAREELCEILMGDIHFYRMGAGAADGEPSCPCLLSLKDQLAMMHDHYDRLTKQTSLTSPPGPHQTDGVPAEYQQFVDDVHSVTDSKTLLGLQETFAGRVGEVEIEIQQEKEGNVKGQKRKTISKRKVKVYEVERSLFLLGQASVKARMAELGVAEDEEAAPVKE